MKSRSTVPAGNLSRVVRPRGGKIPGLSAGANPWANGMDRGDRWAGSSGRIVAASPARWYPMAPGPSHHPGFFQPRVASRSPETRTCDEAVRGISEGPRTRREKRLL